jgi:hypothetical protein
MPTATTSEAARAVATGDRAHRAAQRRADTSTPIAPPFETEQLPDPPAPAIAKPTRPTTLSEAAPWLLRPFPQAVVELKPSATTKDKTRALASPYVDPRAYFARLDKICGLENWSTELTLSDRGAVCKLTIFGVSKCASGDYPIDRTDENVATSAEMQAFKRACAAFGLGRYLYSLPNVWADYDADKKQIIGTAGVVAQMYQALPKGDE